jgi:hypothetical protein
MHLVLSVGTAGGLSKQPLNDPGRQYLNGSNCCIAADQTQNLSIHGSVAASEQHAF